MVPLFEVHVIDPNAYWGVRGAEGASSVIFRVWRCPGLSVNVVGMIAAMRRSSVEVGSASYVTVNVAGSDNTLVTAKTQKNDHVQWHDSGQRLDKAC
jgi:hypothetical protein